MMDGCVLMNEEKLKYIFLYSCSTSARGRNLATRLPWKLRMKLPRKLQEEDLHLEHPCR